MDPISLTPLHLKLSIFSTFSSSIVLTFLVGPVTYPVRAATRCLSHSYDLCAPFPCGGINFTFPFSDSATFGSGPINCGLPQYQIICDNSSSGGPSLQLSGRLYRVKAFSPDWNDRVITVSDTQLVNSLKAGSCESLQNVTIQVPNLSLGQLNRYLNFFRCSSGSSLPPEFTKMAKVSRNCTEGGELHVTLNGSNTGSSGWQGEDCKLVSVPVSDELTLRQLLITNSSNNDTLELLLKAVSNGFSLMWQRREGCDNCELRKGRCGYDSGSGKVVCLCKDGSGKKKSNKRAIVIGIASGSSLLLLIMALSLLILRKQNLLFQKKLDFTNDQNPKERVDAKSFIKTYRSTLLTSYTYKEIKKMTNGFKEKLGEGGYGSVYKGRLPDGRLIAVKMLDKSNNAGRDFINEIATIGRTHHVNIINLFGFCLEGSKQALIYEYMPRGSLADLLGKKGASLSLGMEKLLEIAIGIAHGIMYLHGGCESRILHLDIKPQNILLDQEFTPKISDFGLAKVYSRHRNTITVTGPKGTFGFIAPGIFMRNLGNPSHKSDVYSFGMLLLEMAGERTSNEGMNVGSSSNEAYFPEWVYNRLNKEKINTDNFDSVVEEDGLVSRKMLTIGLWCIQVNPRDRPSMAMVVEMLNSNVEVLEIPPRPFFFTPPSTPPENIYFDDTESSSSLPLRHKSFES